jgi:uncharacterized protein YjbI with pentapeptide repeats
LFNKSSLSSIFQAQFQFGIQQTWSRKKRCKIGLEHTFVKQALSDAKLRGANLDHANLTETDLSGADLSDVHATLTEFGGAILVETVFSGSTLSGAGFQGANLDSANLSKSNLSGADFLAAELNGANLSGADLGVTIFTLTDLHQTNFSHAIIASTYFADVDLSCAVGLDETEHQGPSTIGIDTIYRSGGNIPEVFLRGCGVPETFITYARSLVSKPIDFYSCFISHSTKDKRFCERLYTDLHAKAVRVWYFPEDAKWGEPVWGEIDRSIKRYDKLIVVCSKNSLASGPVLREIERALNREDKEDKNVLFPITIDGYIFDGWEHPRKPDVLAKVVGDFRGWNRSAAKYDVAFKKLLKALKAE